MTIADSLLHVYQVANVWNVQAHGYGLLLVVPIAIVTILDWRLRRAR